MQEAFVSLEDLMEFIRLHQSIPRDVAITSDSCLERDLGITGDDGAELLVAIEKRFQVSFEDLRSLFGLRGVLLKDR